MFAGTGRKMDAVDRISVSLLSPGEEAEYRALEAAAPASQTLAFRDLLADLEMGEPAYFVARAGGRLQGALPAFVRRAPVGAVLNSLPFTQSAGGILARADIAGDDRAALVRALVDALLAYARAQAIDVCVLVGTPYGVDGDARAFPRPPDFSRDRVTHLLDLTRPPALGHAAREALRRASNARPVARVARTVEEAERVWAVYDEAMRRIGAPARPFRVYERMFARLGPDGARFIWAEVDGAIVTAIVLLCHAQVVDYHSAGNTELGRRHQINTWLCVHELEAARARGARWWNWGASPTPAVHDFKRRFGGEDRTYPLWGFVTGDVARLRALTPARLGEYFPGHFVLPYDWLEPPP